VSSRLCSIVEGHADVEAVPVLLRRICDRILPEIHVQIERSIRVPRFRIVRENELERAVDLAARKLGSKGGILIVLDAEDDCPATLGPELLRRARRARSDVACGLVLAKREFESWFLAGAQSLSGKRGLPDDLVPPPDPEAIRGAKEWLTRQMGPGRRYRETLDQPALAAFVDLTAAEAAPSFSKLCREVQRLLDELAR